MKKIYLSFFLVCLTYTSFAQITITKSDMPASNDTVRYSTALSLSNFTNTGANYTWDFSSLLTSGQGIDTFKSAFFIDPLYALLFGLTDYGVPSANTIDFSLLSLTNAYDFYKTSNSYLELNGLGASLSGIPLSFPYNTPDKIYQFPMTYGRVDNSDYDLTMTVPATAQVHQHGTRANTVDGWGTVITPYDTFQCLRLKSVVDELDSLDLTAVGTNIGLEITKVSYKWLAHGQIIPVLEVDGNEILNNFVPTSIKFRDHVRPNTPLFTISIDFTANKTVCTTSDIVTITPTVNPFYVTGESYQYTITPNTYTYVAGTDSTSKNPQLNFTAPGLYTVSLFVSANAITANATATKTKVGYILVTFPAGIIPTEASNPIKVYPNPVNDQLSCQLNGDASKPVMLELSEITGRIVYTMSATQNGVANIPTAQLPAGEYIFKATAAGEKAFTQKVTVIH
jgi:hypothetical protein